MLQVHQGILEKVVHDLFPGKNIFSNVRKETSIKNPQTGSYLEIDVWIPELQLGFEFQDVYHYKTTWESHEPLELIQQKDYSKLESVKSRGDTLIIVPCWWVGDENSLKSSVTFQRPDLFSTFQHPPISLNPPRNHFRNGCIPDIGEMMLASFPSTFQLDESRFASYYTWWMGEKYDGVRCCWHPLDQQLYSRNGLKLPLPSPIMSLFPNAFLDSEIWFGRGFFIESQKTLHALSTPIDWPCFRILTFDLPDPDFFDIPFENRYEALMNSLDYKHSFLILGQRLRAKSKLHVTGFMQHIIENEGEGVILRKPGSLYESGRTESLLKLKAVRGDREALVVDVEADSSLLLQLPTGEMFNIAKKNVQSDIHPHRGDIVSFTFENYSRTSAPTNPKVVRIRKDISWKEVLNDAAAAPKVLLLGDKSKKAMGEKIKPIGYWKADKKKNMRAFFENIAKERGVDPLVPDSWYSVNQAFIKSFKGGPAILWHYKGSYTKALVDLFPEMKLDVRKFANMPMNFWKDLRNRRQFFVNMASKLGFDPLVPDNWYSVDEATILSHKGAASLEFYYPKGFARALVHLFPEIGLDAAKFISLPYNHWHEPQNRRTYLDYFAESKGYDPLSPESWYLMLKDRLLTTKNLSSLLSFYKGNISSALLHLYPNIGLDPINLNSVARDFWKDVGNRRDFFLRIAQAQSFDPMEPENWYQVKPETIASTMGATSVLAFYNNSYIEALHHLFPGIKFDEAKFITSPRNHFAEVAHRRKFEQFARAKGFDPLFVSNWYHMPKEAVMSMKGATSMLFLYGNSYSRAIMHLFPELKWDPAKFSRRKNHWQLETNRKDFFVDFAKDKGIDLMSAEAWYKVRSGEILAVRGAEAVLQHYDGNFGKALAVLFPNMGVDLKRFESPPKKRWRDPTLRRKFFLDFARAQSFDYRDPNNWYPLTHEAILSHKGAHSVLWYYGGSFAKALIELFPEMPLDFHKFTHPPYSFWKDERHRIEFFTRFAEEEGFNPLVADNWYQSVDKLLARKGVNSILHHHEGSVSVALTQLFPNVTFDSTKLKPRIDSYWIVKQNRRKFFKDFALDNSFDPLVAANWSQVDENKLKSAKGAAAVLSYYSGSVSKALSMLFPDFDFGTNVQKEL